MKKLLTSLFLAVCVVMPVSAGIVVDMNDANTVPAAYEVPMFTNVEEVTVTIQKLDEQNPQSVQGTKEAVNTLMALLAQNGMPDPESYSAEFLKATSQPDLETKMLLIGVAYARAANDGHITKIYAQQRVVNMLTVFEEVVKDAASRGQNNLSYPVTIIF